MTITKTVDPVACVVCDTVIADFNDTGLASAMSDHVAACDGHSYTGCKHKGRCWKRTTNQPEQESR